MRKVLAAGAVFFSLIGCANNNQIAIVNYAQESIMFNFRATEYDVESGASATIKNIPNGTYGYNTSYAIPAGATAASSGAVGGSLSFEREQTHQLLIYSSTLIAGTYTLYVNQTSTDSTGSAAMITGPK
jgi:hypothetical protein